MTDPYTMHTLPNGLRIVIERMPDVCSVAVGFLARVGARDETPELAGVSHFLEHMMFKGTAKRSWREITIDFDRMGSSYNAFTSEDRTVYYGWVRSNDLEPQLELLSDMIRSKIPQEEFDTEKNVVLEEIAMSKDNLDHVAIEFVQEKVFAGHSLAWPILGYDATVKALTRDQMWNHFQKNYAPDNLVLIVAGNVDPQKVIKLAESYCGAWPMSGTVPQRVLPTLRGGVDVLPVDRFKQQIVVLTFPAVSASDPRSEEASALATILGGDNSRFFWNIVQTGISSRAGAYYADYTDCGAMMLYGACPPDNVERLVEAIRSEARRIHEKGVTRQEVERVKNRRRTSVAVEGEVPYHRLTQLMDDIEYRGKPRTVDQILAEVDAVSAESIAAYLEAFPIQGEGHLASVGPRNWPVVSG
ncbi:MAG: insulinase family protein [Phycisphaerae bacterium]|nr:insulinase family protein [Phycisphaerae bacterium]